MTTEYAIRYADPKSGALKEMRFPNEQVMETFIDRIAEQGGTILTVSVVYPTTHVGQNESLPSDGAARAASLSRKEPRP